MAAVPEPEADAGMQLFDVEVPDEANGKFVLSTCAVMLTYTGIKVDQGRFSSMDRSA